MLKELLPDYIYSNVKEFEKDYNFINENVLSKVKEKISNLYQLKKDKTTLLKIEKIIIYIVIKKLLIKSQNSKQNIDKVITDAIRQEKLLYFVLYVYSSLENKERIEKRVEEVATHFKLIKDSELLLREIEASSADFAHEKLVEYLKNNVLKNLEGKYSFKAIEGIKQGVVTTFDSGFLKDIEMMYQKEKEYLFLHIRRIQNLQMTLNWIYQYLTFSILNLKLI